MYIIFTLTFLYLFTGSFSGSINSKCKVSDLTCIENALNAELPHILEGIPELGIEGSDPLFIENIEVNLLVLNFTSYNSTGTGYKNCKISNLKMDDDMTTLHFDANCPNACINGQYTMSGQLSAIPLKARGTYHFCSEKYIIKLDLETKKYQGRDGKTHFHIESFALKAIPFNVIFGFKNFLGQQTLAYPESFLGQILEPAQEIWNEVGEFIQEPLWRHTIQKIILKVNKYFDNMALEDVLFD